MTRNIAAIILVMLLWSSCYPLITVGIEYSPHLTFAAMRASIAGIALLIAAKAFGHAMPKDGRVWLKLSAIGLGATTFGFFGMFHAAEYVSPGIATVINNTQPLMAAVLAHMFLREYLSVSAIWGLVIGFLGIVVIAIPELSVGNEGNSYLLGVAYIILAALGVTISNVLIRGIAGTVSGLSAMGWQLTLGSIPLWGMALLWEDQNQVQWTGTFLFSLLGLAIFGTAFVYWLWFRVLEQTPLTRANVFTFLVPIFGLTMGVTFFEETITSWTIAGAALTLFGIYKVNRRTRKLLSKA
jgi:drug/metabolite transporter (DMT)-like permease